MRRAGGGSDGPDRVFAFFISVLQPEIQNSQAQ